MSVNPRAEIGEGAHQPDGRIDVLRAFARQAEDEVDVGAETVRDRDAHHTHHVVEMASAPSSPRFTASRSAAIRGSSGEWNDQARSATTRAF